MVPCVCGMAGAPAFARATVLESAQIVIPSEEGDPAKVLIFAARVKA
jgi:hypothetical protein